MLICRPCLTKNYHNFGEFTSFGICELCNLHSMCHNIPVGNLSPRPAKGARIVGVEEFIQKEKARMESMKPSDWAMEHMVMPRPDSDLEKERKKNELKSPVGIETTSVDKMGMIKRAHHNISTIKIKLKTKPMISNEDYSTEKSPWRWLWHGDKAYFLLAWIIFVTIFTAGSWEYGWVTVFWIQATIGSIGLFLIGWRIRDYILSVRRVDILSFPAWYKFKKSH